MNPLPFHEVARCGSWLSKLPIFDRSLQFAVMQIRSCASHGTANSSAQPPAATPRICITQAAVAASAAEGDAVASGCVTHAASVASTAMANKFCTLPSATAAE